MLQIVIFLLFSVCSSVLARSSWRPSNSPPSACECFRKCEPHMFMPYSPILPPSHSHWSVEAQRALGLPVSSVLPFMGPPPSPYQELQFPLVLPLIHGNFSSNDDKLAMHPSVVLVIDRNASTNEKEFILVDTGLSLFKHNLVAVVITHSDTDTMGNLNLFPCAEVLSSNRIAKENFFIQQKMPTFDGNRSDLPFHKLFENTELYLTPGFGLQDHSLIVRNVENHGTVAIVGKLVLNETDLASSNMAIREFATDDVEQRKLWQATRREIVCLSDYIIPGHGVPFKDSQFEELTKDNSESEGYDDEEELEYDAINDETFGATVNEINENDLEAFANSTADLILDDPSCSINAPDPSQIPLPQVNSVFCKGTYEGSFDKIWDNTAFNGMQSLASDFSGHMNKISIDPLNTISNNSNPTQVTNSHAPALAGAKTLEEIERDAVLNSSSTSVLPNPIGTYPQSANIPVSKPGEPLNIKELEKRMLSQAALASRMIASAIGPSTSNAIAQVISHKSEPLPWMYGPPPVVRHLGFSPGMMPPFARLPFLPRNPIGPLPPGMFPPPFFGPDGMCRPPMYPFHGPPPPIHSNANAYPPNKNFYNNSNNNQPQQHSSTNQNYQKNSRGVRSLPVPGSWMPVQANRQSNNQSPFQPDSVAQCGYSRQPYSVQRSTVRTPVPNRQRQKGLPSGRTISDFAFDPYAGFMSKKEREWLIKIHLIQCMGSGEPMEDDFYYTMWKQRNVLDKAPEEWKVKLQPKYYNFDDTYPSAAYIQPSFSGSLGRPTHCSANFPRQMIDLSVDNPEEEDLINTKNTQKKLKAMLMRIENAALVLLKCNELKRKLSSGDLDEHEEIACKSTLKEQMDLLISCTCAKDKLPTIMLIQKGRVLLFQIMAAVLQQTHLFDILKVLIETMPKYAKKIPEASVTDCVKNISGFVSLLSKDQFVELVNMAVVEKQLINISKFVQITQFSFLVGLSKHEVDANLICKSSLSSWLSSEASECVLLPEIDKLFPSEDLFLITNWLLKQDMVKPINCASLLSSRVAAKMLKNSNRTS